MSQLVASLPRRLAARLAGNLPDGHQNICVEEGVRWPIRALTALIASSCTASSQPFEAGKHGKAAVKIVDDRGIESLKILPLVKA